MKITDIIRKKKHKEELSKEEINYAVNGFVKGEVKDYQMSALLMAIYFNSMTKKEIADLTMSMVNSGATVDLSSIEGVKVDKHSTGGVGDKISIIVLPVVASLGIPVAKLSGRGLGHTGGTIDKLESIEGFRTSLAMEEFLELVNKSGLALSGGTSDMNPADKKIYALRDVTETVDSIPLIASSIMSKKIASGADAIVLDVKCGEGAFMRTYGEAVELSREMVDIGKNTGRNTIAVITDMNQPLGFEVGNANEIIEACEILKGKKIRGLYDVAVEISSYMIMLGKKTDNQEMARKMVIETIENGHALEKFREFVKNQGGNPDFIEDYSKLPTAKFITKVTSDKSGYITAVKALETGLAAMNLGAGRKTKEDSLDYSAGVTLKKLKGDRVVEGEVIAELHHNMNDVTQSVDLIREAFVISDSNQNQENSFILDVIK